MTKTYRLGPLGSIFDVYEQALNDFIVQLNAVSLSDYERIVRPDAQDPECQSIQKMMGHVVGAGYAYANYARTAFGMEMSKPEIGTLSQPEAVDRLRQMFAYSLDTFEGRWSMTDEELSAVNVQTRWGPLLDLEALFEHAICHLLRHARMIEMYQLPALV